MRFWLPCFVPPWKCVLAILPWRRTKLAIIARPGPGPPSLHPAPAGSPRRPGRLLGKPYNSGKKQGLPKMTDPVDSVTLRRPDDWHVHLRDGPALAAVVAHTARVFARAIVMPNLKPPVTTVAAAEAYRARILAA